MAMKSVVAELRFLNFTVDLGSEGVIILTQEFQG